MKKIILLVAILFGSLNAVEVDLLTGDTRLSCEAILCLSSSVKPGECQPSLNRFFSIKEKKMGRYTKCKKSIFKTMPCWRKW